jgi:hypothetical protein
MVGSERMYPVSSNRNDYRRSLRATLVTLSFWEPEGHVLPFVPNQAGFVIGVSDVSAARVELEAKGVEFIAETWDSGVCHFAAFRDPDGNTVILHRRYAPGTARPSLTTLLREALREVAVRTCFSPHRSPARRSGGLLRDQ